MIKTKLTIINDIEEYINSRDSDHSNWYVGITNGPKKRVFDQHKVKHNYIWRKANSSDDARYVEESFIDKGCDGGTGGGDEDSEYVYAYKIESYTIE